MFAAILVHYVVYRATIQNNKFYMQKLLHKNIYIHIISKNKRNSSYFLKNVLLTLVSPRGSRNGGGTVCRDLEEQPQKHSQHTKSHIRL